MMATDTMSAFFRIAWLLFVVALVSGTQVYAQGGPPSFSKVFQPSTIGPGSSATLVFTIQNTAPSPATSLAFTDVLPAGLTIANGSNPSSTCAGTLTAPEGSDTITLSGGQVVGSSTCTISINVTSSAPGTHTNTSGDLTSSAGNSGPATTDLTVATNRPGFSKTFSSTTLPSGSRSTLTFTIDNSLNTGNTFNGNFTDALPAGVVFADPAALTVNCEDALFPPTISINEDTQTLTGSGISLPAGAAICTISVDVVATGVGPRYNVSSDYNSASGNSGKATATLNLTQTPLSIIKEFTDDPAPQGGNATLEFTIRNANRGATATAISFSDDLDATLSGLIAAGLPMNDVCGPGSQISGTSTLTLSGGTLGEGETCTFGVTLEIPADAENGVYPDTTSAVTAMVNGTPQTGNQAIDNLFVAPVPSITKTFLDDAAAAGGTATVEFSITNTSPDDPATDLRFTDDLTSFISGTTANMLPAPGFCGPSSTIIETTNVPPFGNTSLLVENASLDPGDTCTFQVELNIAGGTSNGTYTNTTSTITGTVDGNAVEGPSDSDTLDIVSAPTLSKVFTDDPVAPGDMVTLEFTLTLNESAPGDATDIAFTDDLDATLSGLVAVGLPQNDVCGPGSTLSGTSTITFSGGTVSPNSLCTFSVTLQVPAGAPGGSYPNTTSTVTAMVSGFAVSSEPATDNLDIVTLSLDKEFTDDPVGPGQNVTLEFTLTNDDPVETATDIAFTDDLDATLSGLVATGLPMMDVCGAGSQISGTSLLTLTGGTLAPGTSCTFNVTLQVPGGAAFGEYPNTTSDVTATIGGSPVTAPPATDNLFIIDPLEISITKAFTDDPVAPGDPVTLEFTIDFTGVATDATGITFTDDLDATLSGLAATGLPMMDVCGAGSQISGTSLLTLTGGTLAPGTSCTFSVTLQVPGDAPSGTFPNTTSTVTADVDGTPISGDPATDDLVVSGIPDVSATKVDAVFDAGGDGTLNPGDTIEYTVALTNNGGRAAAGVTFDDTPEVNTTLVVGSVTTSQGTVTTGNTGGDTSVAVDVGDIGNGETVTITFQAMIDSPFPAGVTQVCNQGTVSGSNFDDVLTGDPDATGPGDPEDTTCTPVTANPDLAITKDDGDVTVEPGGTITYTIEYANNGDQGATGVEITDTVPEGTTFDAGASTPGWSCINGAPAGTVCTFAVAGEVEGGGGTGMVTFTVVVDNPIAAGLEEIENTASIDDDGTNGDDPNPDDNTDSDTTPIEAAPDVSATKTDVLLVDQDGDGQADPGDTIGYTIEVTNDGDQDVADVVVTDTVDPLLDLDCGSLTPGQGTVVSCTPGPGGSFTVDLTEIDGEPRLLAPQATAQITFSATIVVPFPATADQVANQATVSYTGETGTEEVVSDDPDTARPHDPTVTPINLTADLELTKTASTTTPNFGTQVTFTLTVTNQGPVDVVTGVEVRDVLPSGLTFVSAEGDGDYRPETGIWDLHGITMGVPETIEITVIVDGLNPITNVAEVLRADLPDPDSVPGDGQGDDFDTVTLTPITADLELSKRLASRVESPDGTTVTGTFTLTLTNKGPSPATGVEVMEFFAGEMTFVSASPAGAFNPATSTWTVGTLAVGASTTLSITVTAPTGGIVINLAEVSAVNETDPDSTPLDGTGDDFAGAALNRGNVSFPPLAADLSITKEVSQPQPILGEHITYIITISNAGPFTTAGVVVTDLLPEGLLFVSASASSDDEGCDPCSYDAETGEWTIGKLTDGETATLMIVVEVTAEGEITNTAKITQHHLPDPDSDISLDNPNEDDVATATASVASGKATSIVRSGGEGIPETFEMSQNYPNPFNPQTTIPFGVPQAGRVVVEVYNLLGQRVAVLMDQELAAGRHEVVWQALDQPTGMYLVRMVAGKTTLTRRVTLVK